MLHYIHRKKLDIINLTNDFYNWIDLIDRNKIKKSIYFYEDYGTKINIKLLNESMYYIILYKYFYFDFYYLYSIEEEINKIKSETSIYKLNNIIYIYINGKLSMFVYNDKIIEYTSYYINKIYYKKNNIVGPVYTTYYTNNYIIIKSKKIIGCKNIIYLDYQSNIINEILINMYNENNKIYYYKNSYILNMCLFEYNSKLFIFG